MRRLLRNILCVVVPVLLIAGCGAKEDFDIEGHPVEDNSAKDYGSRTGTGKEHRRVMLLYSAGLNSLHSYLSEDIRDLWDGYIPSNKVSDNVLLVFSRNAGSGFRYSGCVPSSPVLFRLYRDQRGEIISDTLIVYPTETIASDKGTMKEVLTTCHTMFPTDKFGMVFSSHASGWLPEGYYNNPSVYDPDYSDGSADPWSSIRYNFPSGSYTFEPNLLYPDLPAVKSVGQDLLAHHSPEMTLKSFREAIPFKLEYLLFDACLMGCVETAWELKDVAGIVGFSQAEVLADGFDYKKIASHLLEGEESDPTSVCRDYFESYNAQTGIGRSATISLVDCSKLAPLGQICATLFDKYRSQILALDYHAVQGFYRFERHFYFDLLDILLQAGINPDEQKALEQAVADCMIYRAATPSFIKTSDGGFDIRIFSGLTMYLPACGTTYLNNFYKSEILWNDATGLVK